MAETTTVTTLATLYLPGGTHGFPPGSVITLPAGVAADLVAAGHVVITPPDPPAA